MSVPAGFRLGPYEIVAPIGAGGMGEVYRARDTRLGREVAVKVLPSAVSADAGRRERFEREARAISRLSHPNVCTLHDVGRHDGIDYLVMELLDGESLADRLQRGPLPLAQVLRYGSEIARALAQAHRQGIVHRDLKPGNVMLTRSGAKVLDFGLARHGGMEQGRNAALSAGPTEQRPITEEGSILGTIPYMAPEQVEGRPADARSDMFALGSVLYEMATGRRAFVGKSKASLIASILEHDPEPVTTHQPASPRALDRVIRIALRKDPEERWQNAQDVALALESIGEDGPPRNAGRRTWVVASVALALAALAGALVTRAFLDGSRTEERAPVQFTVYPPDGEFVPLHRQHTLLALSPEGGRIAFVSSPSGVSKVWIHSLVTNETNIVPGSEGGTSPFWSPDGNFLGFYADGKLVKANLRTGDVQRICAVSKTGVVADWGADGTIVFLENAGAPPVVKRVSAAGGSPEAIGGEPDVGRWRGPQFLPDGKHFLVFKTGTPVLRRMVYLRSLDGKTMRPLFETDSKVRFAPSGWVAYVRDGALLARRFDLAKLEAVGDPVTLAPAVHFFRATGVALFDISDSTLVYQAVASANQLVWVEADGTAAETVGSLEGLQAPAISPDGKSIAVSVPDSKAGLADIWVYDLERGFRNRITSRDWFESFPIWSPDGESLIFASDREGPPHLHWIRLDEPANVVRLTEPDFIQMPTDWSRDGRFVLFTKLSVDRGSDIWILPMTGEERTPRLLLDTDSDERDGRFSPDGGWVSFTADDTGSPEVYVVAVDRPSVRLRVSVAGGKGARWNADGSQLFYIDGEGSLLSVQVTAGATIAFGRPRVMARLEGTRAASAEIDEDYAFDPNRGRFLINRANTGTLSVPIEVVHNWTSKAGE